MFLRCVPMTLLCIFAGFSLLSAEDEPPIELVDPETAPLDIRPLVMKGYRIMLYTKKELPEYAGDLVSCNNCHFDGGNTLGGVNGGISLVGVTDKYPVLIDGNKPYTLADRINACFEKSLNGKPIPKTGEAMQSLLAYLAWISTPVTGQPHPVPTPWLGMKKIRIEHTMDPKAGAEIYAAKCALCHGVEGQGQPRPDDLSYPPLWGPHAFNDAAGMNQLPILATFILQNMPYDDPSLTLEQALDVAAFIISRPRPHYVEAE